MYYYIPGRKRKKSTPNSDDMKDDDAAKTPVPEGEAGDGEDQGEAEEQDNKIPKTVSGS